MGSEISLKKKERNKMNKKKEGRRKMKKNEMEGNKIKFLALVIVLSTKE